MEKQWVVLDDGNKSDLRKILLKNRKVKDEKAFLQPYIHELPKVSKQLPQVEKAVGRIQKAIKNNELIDIYGGFDVDGITGTAILWETLDLLGAKVMPYIPHREKEGYGLHSEALEKLSKEGAKVVISVDCGITAVDQAKLAKKLGVDLIITDHHEPPKILPKPHTLLHTTDLAGSGVAFRLAEALLESANLESEEQFYKNLELAAIGTVADMVPLVGSNRIIVKSGLPYLSKSSRLGLKSLYAEASLHKNIGTGQIGFAIAPRLNAMGRMEHALDSLRLLLTRKESRARELAGKLSNINGRRQQATKEAVNHAKDRVEKEYNGAKILILDSNSYQQGVVGLVAGKLVEQYYRPSAVISVNKELSRGSARSISGYHITNALGSGKEYLENFGGHPMAAGFSIKSENIDKFREKMIKHAEKSLTEKDLKPTLKIDTKLSQSNINNETMTIVKEFEPFGIGNPEPTFLTENLEVLNARTVGSEGKHLKLVLRGEGQATYDAIWFSYRKDMPEKGSLIDVVHNLDENTWNGTTRLQLKIKDVRKAGR